MTHDDNKAESSPPEPRKAASSLAPTQARRDRWVGVGVLLVSFLASLAISWRSAEIVREGVDPAVQP